MTDLSTLYRTDYHAWATRHAQLLKSGQIAELDTTHLIEELEGMGKSERHELESGLSVLIPHLLKWQYQYNQLAAQWKEFDTRRWRSTIIEQRTRIAKRWRQSPGLKAELTATIAEAYADAVEFAHKEAGLPPTTFPAACPYSEDQLLGDDWYPPRS